MNHVIAVYSEAGGATKTTTAVSLAVAACNLGHSVDLIDLDPRAAATKWLGVKPEREWAHVGAILDATPEPRGWVNDLALRSSWPEAPRLRVVPAARSLSNRERGTDDHIEARLLMALEGSTATVTVLDLPNRQGGPLVQNALTAATTVLYAAKLDEDGLDGVDGAVRSVRRFARHREQIGAPVCLREAGIVVGAVRDTIMTIDSKRALHELRAGYGDLVLAPLVPDRVIVREARAAGRYYGSYERGEIVHRAYVAIGPAGAGPMTDPQRPVARPRPRAANDDEVDPVVPGNGSTRAARRGPEPTVQVNVRMSVAVHELLEDAVAATGLTRRQLVEAAIRASYG